MKEREERKKGKQERKQGRKGRKKLIEIYFVQWKCTNEDTT